MPIAQAMSSFWNTPSSIRRNVFSQCGVQSGVARSAGISMRCVHDSVSAADRIERDQAQVVGMEDRDRVREDHVARRRQLAQRRHVARATATRRPSPTARRRGARPATGCAARSARSRSGRRRRTDRSCPCAGRGCDTPRGRRRRSASSWPGTRRGWCGTGAGRRCRRTAARRRGRRGRTATSIVALGRRHDPEQAVALLGRQRDQALGARVAGVERLGMQAMAQRAFEPIRPAVVRADDARLRQCLRCSRRRGACRDDGRR